MKQQTIAKGELKTRRSNPSTNGLVTAEAGMMFEDHFIREVRVQYQRTERERFTIGHADDVARFVRAHLVDNSREQFVALYLDASHSVACYSLLSIGVANSALVHPRELFQRAVLTGAIAIIVAHNHPSGSCKPSEADRMITKRLCDAGDVLGISVLDHVIVTDDTHYSLKTEEHSLFTERTRMVA